MIYNRIIFFIYLYLLHYHIVYKFLMGHRVGPYIGLNEIGSSMMNFITINYLFNFIFGFIR